jgi:hypothetical protein
MALQKPHSLVRFQPLPPPANAPRIFTMLPARAHHDFETLPLKSLTRSSNICAWWIGTSWSASPSIGAASLAEPGPVSQAGTRAEAAARSQPPSAEEFEGKTLSPALSRKQLPAL